MFYNSKEKMLTDKCQLVASEVSSLDVLNTNSVSQAVSNMERLSLSTIIVTDQNGVSIYNSDAARTTQDEHTVYPEIATALQGNDVFNWSYHDGIMCSTAAVPIYSYGTMIGCVYMVENDAQQGALIQSLQTNVLITTISLELIVIAFSITFSRLFTNRLRKIMDSIRIVREGDYSHTLELSGNDELNVLGNEFNGLISRLQISEQKRRQFVSDASHELKTPLASIKLLSDSVLQNDMDIETIREFMQDIGNEADRLNRMTQKLLSLSKIESQSESDFEITYIGPTVEKVVRMLKVIADHNNISITTDLTGDSPILILEDDLYQILFNLVENGIKYNVPGGNLSVQLHRSEDDAVIRICDTGVGIPEDALDNIFERFYRVDKARSRKSGGSGLGLSIVQNMVERNRGKIEVSSVVGQGTCFTITFPIFDTEEESE